VLALFPKLPEPVNVATIECVPPARVDVANVALPDETATFEASVVAPSVNVTVPVGVPPDEVIVAVKVTDAPEFDGLADEASAVEVEDVATFTTCVSVAVLGVPDVGVKVVLIEWLPTASVLDVNVAWPLTTATPLARTVLPSLNDAVPVAVRGVTVSVNVTLCPDVAGLSDDERATVGFAGVVLGRSGNVAFV
jgi:hypothetical protein